MGRGEGGEAMRRLGRFARSEGFSFLASDGIADTCGVWGARGGCGPLLRALVPTRPMPTKICRSLFRMVKGCRVVFAHHSGSSLRKGNLMLLVPEAVSGLSMIVKPLHSRSGNLNKPVYSCPPPLSTNTPSPTAPSKQHKPDKHNNTPGRPTDPPSSLPNRINNVQKT